MKPKRYSVWRTIHDQIDNMEDPNGEHILYADLPALLHQARVEGAREALLETSAFLMLRDRDKEVAKAAEAIVASLEAKGE